MNYKEYNELNIKIKVRFVRYYNTVNYTTLNITRVSVDEIEDNVVYICVFYSDNTTMSFRLPIKLIEMPDEEFEYYFNVLQQRLESRFYKFFELEKDIFLYDEEIYIKRIYDDYVLIHHVQFALDDAGYKIYRMPRSALLCTADEFEQFINERDNDN